MSSRIHHESPPTHITHMDSPCENPGTIRGRKLQCNLSNEERAPWCLEYIGDEVLASYAGILINHHKNPYKTRKIRAVSFFVAHLPSLSDKNMRGSSSQNRNHWAPTKRWFSQFPKPNLRNHQIVLVPTKPFWQISSNRWLVVTGRFALIFKWELHGGKSSKPKGGLKV